MRARSPGMPSARAAPLALALAVGHMALGVRSMRLRSPMYPHEPLVQPPGMPKVVPGRYYVFITHHKTGTNLMQQICNLTAMAVSGGRDQCGFCYAMLSPYTRLGATAPVCPPSNTMAHGPLRGTFSRFTLISNMDGMQFEVMRHFAPNFLAIHMVRDPVNMAISSFQYDEFLLSKEGSQWNWDMAVPGFAKLTRRQRIQEEARRTIHYAEQMLGVHKVAAGDERVLEMELEDFQTDHRGSTARLFKHLWRELSSKQLSRLHEAVRIIDRSHMNYTTKIHDATIAAGVLASNKTSIANAIRKIQKESPDRNVNHLVDISRMMGFSQYSDLRK